MVAVLMICLKNFVGNIYWFEIMCEWHMMRENEVIIMDIYLPV